MNKKTLKLLCLMCILMLCWSNLKIGEAGFVHPSRRSTLQSFLSKNGIDMPDPSQIIDLSAQDAKYPAVLEALNKIKDNNAGLVITRKRKLPIKSAYIDWGHTLSSLTREQLNQVFGLFAQYSIKIYIITYESYGDEIYERIKGLQHKGIVESIVECVLDKYSPDTDTLLKLKRMTQSSISVVRVYGMNKVDYIKMKEENLETVLFIDDDANNFSWCPREVAMVGVMTNSPAGILLSKQNGYDEFGEYVDEPSYYIKSLQDLSFLRYLLDSMIVPTVIADKHLRMIKEEAERNAEEVMSVRASSIVVNPETGERTYYSKGKPFVVRQAYVYVKEGEGWETASHMKLPEKISKLIHAEEGALVVMAGPFYVESRKFPPEFKMDPKIRPLTDEEVYARYGLKRVYDAENKPFEIPVLGVGDRSILLPLAYTVMNTALNEKRHVFGLEFKGAGTPSYKKHNLNHMGIPATVYESYSGRAGIFLDWWHQIRMRVPVGFAENYDAIGPEAQLLQYGANFTRLNCANLPLGEKSEYSIKMRISLGEYRRLAIFFDENGHPQQEVLQEVIEELGITAEEYLMRLAQNYGATLKMLIEGGHIRGSHASMIDCDIWGNVTDIEDFGKVKTGNEPFFLEAVLNWVDNLFKVVALLPEKNAPENFLEDIQKAFALGYFSSLEDYDDARAKVVPIGNQLFNQVVLGRAIKLFKERRKEEAFKIEQIYIAA
ncbi:hypothetical protein ACFL3D_03090 [Candidatus Omnitrophota bacterium]